MPRQKVTTTPEVSTEVMKAEAIALVQQSSITELEAAINTTLLQGEELLRRSDLGRLEFTLSTLEVTNAQQLETAGEFLLALKNGKAKCTAFWDNPNGLKKVFYALWKLICQSQANGEKRFDAGIAQIESIIKPYLQQLKAEQEAEQRRLAEVTESLRKQKDSEARTAMLEGDMRGAAIFKEQAKSIQTPVLPVESTKLEGLSTRPKKLVTITDPMALVKAIAAGDAPISVIKEWNMVYLRDMAMQDVVYPGTTCEDDVTFARRSS